MLKYFYGEDTYGAREDIVQLAKNSEIHWVDREALDHTPFEQWLDRAGGGLFGAAVLVVQDPSGLLQAQQEAILEAIETIQQQSIVILWDRTKWDKRSRLFRSLKPYAHEYPLLDSGRCIKWVNEQAAARKVMLDPRAAQLLIQYAGADRWRLQSELERLSLLDVPITAEVVTQHVIPVRAEIEIFPLLDALSAGKQADTVRQLEQLWRVGQNEFYVLSMLMYQFRTLLTIRQGQAHAPSPDAVARQIGLNPFVVKKNWHVASRLSVGVCLQALSRIMATDFGIKQGKVESRTAVTMLVLALVHDCAPAKHRV